MSATDACDYQLQLSRVDDSIDSEPCPRPVWEDHEHCFWHAKVDGKTIADFDDTDVDAGANLDGAYLKAAELMDIDGLAECSLVGATLADAHIMAVDLSKADLRFATFAGVNAMAANFRGANLEGAVFTDADLRRADLEDTRLNEAVFTNVHMGGGTTFGERSVYEYEETDPQMANGTHPLEAAAGAYRELQQIYEDNALPKLARRSYKQEKDARRRLTWDRGAYAEALKWELSRFVMGYGSSPYRILATSLVLIVVAALLFPFTGGIQEVQGDTTITYTLEDPQNASHWWLGEVLFKSFYFSVVTFSTLGYGDIQPLGTWARLLAGVETILGAALSALLVFVLARSVTW